MGSFIIALLLIIIILLVFFQMCIRDRPTTMPWIWSFTCASRWSCI